MKELSSIDIYCLLKEWNLTGAKIQKIFQPGDILFQLHIPRVGKTFLRINNKFIFLSNFKEEQAQPKGFCMQLRKYITNSKIIKAEQVGFERIIHFEIQKEEKFDMYIEVFGKGNIILMKDGVVVCSKHSTTSYNSPERLDLKNLTLEQLKNILNQENSIVKTLARDVGLGGFYSEYLLSDMDKKEVANKVDPKIILSKLSELLNKPIKPQILDGRPFPFDGTKGSFSELISKEAIKSLEEERLTNKLSSYNEAKKKLDTIIEAQTNTIKKLNETIKTNSEVGEKIYENYSLVEEILTQIQKAKKTKTWKEIKEILKDHKLIKELNEKDGSITLEL